MVKQCSLDPSPRQEFGLEENEQLRGGKDFISHPHHLGANWVLFGERTSNEESVSLTLPSFWAMCSHHLPLLIHREAQAQAVMLVSTLLNRTSAKEH